MSFKMSLFVFLVSKLSLKPMTLMSRPNVTVKWGPTVIKRGKCDFPSEARLPPNE